VSCEVVHLVGFDVSNNSDDVVDLDEIEVNSPNVRGDTQPF